MNFMKKILLLSLSLAPFSTVYGVTNDAQQPINIESKTQNFDMKKNTIIFDGDVVITQGSIKINADKVIILRQKGKKEIINAYGKPMKFHQLLENDKPIDGQANQAHYDLGTEFLTLTGNAELKQRDSFVKANKITYDVKKQQLKAAKQNSSSRVKTVLIPTQLQDK